MREAPGWLPAAVVVTGGVSGLCVEPLLGILAGLFDCLISGRDLPTPFLSVSACHSHSAGWPGPFPLPDVQAALAAPLALRVCPAGLQSAARSCLFLMWPPGSTKVLSLRGKKDVFPSGLPAPQIQPPHSHRCGLSKIKSNPVVFLPFSGPSALSQGEVRMRLE